MAVSTHKTSTKDEPLRPRTFALVMNAQAGGLLGQSAAARALEERLKAAGDEVSIVPPDAGTLPERVAKARATRAACVVVAGGDGTVACAASALAGSGVALGIIPCGTMNFLAKDLRIDPADHAAAVDILATGVVRAIDVGTVGEHIFLCASMLGTPARLSRHREAGRQRGNGVLAWAGFGWAALRALWHNRSMRVVLRFDGREVVCRSPSITITVNRLDDGTGRLFARSDLSGGELGVYVVRRSPVWRQALLLLRTAVSGRLSDPQIDFFATTALEVEGRDQAMHVLVDGEMRLIRPPLRYGIRPGALRVMTVA